MPYQTRWYLPKRIAYLELLGQFTEDELFASSTQMRDRYLSSGVAPVHVVVDVRGLNNYIRDVRVLRQGASIYLKHPALGWVALLGVENPVVNYSVSLTAYAMGCKVTSVRSLADVQRVLRRLDATL